MTALWSPSKELALDGLFAMAQSQRHNSQLLEVSGRAPHTIAYGSLGCDDPRHFDTVVTVAPNTVTVACTVARCDSTSSGTGYGSQRAGHNF